MQNRKLLILKAITASLAESGSADLRPKIAAQNGSLGNAPLRAYIKSSLVVSYSVAALLGPNACPSTILRC